MVQVKGSKENRKEKVRVYINVRSRLNPECDLKRRTHYESNRNCKTGRLSRKSSNPY